VTEFYNRPSTAHRTRLIYDLSALKFNQNCRSVEGKGI